MHAASTGDGDTQLQLIIATSSDSFFQGNMFLDCYVKSSEF